MKLAVLGAGESGVGTAILAQKQGYDVFVSDMGTIKDNYKQKLNEHNIRWEEGHHTEEEILSANEVVKSPGILLFSANWNLQSVTVVASASVLLEATERLPPHRSSTISCRSRDAT